MNDSIGNPKGDDAGGRVAYQGAPGSSSHAACLSLRPWDAPVGYETFAQAMEALLTGACDCALIPVENSTIGVVQPAATLVARCGLEPVTEVWWPVRLALMGPEGARLSDVRTAESHPVALDQCVGSLSALKLEAVEAYDTGGAAQQVALAGDISRAAVAPPSAAEVYGLTILKNDMQDRSDNRTRFVLLVRERG